MLFASTTNYSHINAVSANLVGERETEGERKREKQGTYAIDVERREVEEEAPNFRLVELLEGLLASCQDGETDVLMEVDGVFD